MTVDLAGVAAIRRLRVGEVFATGTITIEPDGEATTTTDSLIPGPTFTAITDSLEERGVKGSFPEMVSTPRAAKDGQAITATLTIPGRANSPAGSRRG